MLNKQILASITRKSLKAKTAVYGFLAACTLTATTLAAANNIPAYSKGAGVSGTLKSVGSDTMNNQMSLWQEGFNKYYPNVKISVEGKGSATAPAALIDGTAQLGPMSRPMKSEEISLFKKKFGYEPTGVKTSLDVLTVFVHRDNPLASLSVEQIDAIFSKTRKGGAAKSVETWGDLGLKGEWANKPIQLYGRNSASGTYAYFKEHALFKGDFKDSVKEQPGSSAVVQAVSSDKYAIGYSGFGYVTSGIKALALSQKKGKAISPSKESAYSGIYPFTRFLLIYLNKEPTKELDPLRREFLRYVLSEQGQKEVEKDGYIPLSPTILKQERTKLGILN